MFLALVLLTVASVYGESNCPDHIFDEGCGSKTSPNQPAIDFATLLFNNTSEDSSGFIIKDSLPEEKSQISIEEGKGTLLLQFNMTITDYLPEDVEIRFLQNSIVPHGLPDHAANSTTGNFPISFGLEADGCLPSSVKRRLKLLRSSPDQLSSATGETTLKYHVFKILKLYKIWMICPPCHDKGVKMIIECQNNGVGIHTNLSLRDRPFLVIYKVRQPLTDTLPDNSEVPEHFKIKKLKSGFAEGHPPTGIKHVLEEQEGDSIHQKCRKVLKVIGMEDYPPLEDGWEYLAPPWIKDYDCQCHRRLRPLHFWPFTSECDDCCRPTVRTAFSYLVMREDGTELKGIQAAEGIVNACGGC